MVILFIVSVTAFLPDCASSIGAVTSIAQSNSLPDGEWNIPQTTVNHSLVGSLFMLGAGGIVVIILSTYYGRAPVLFWFLSFTVPTAVWCGVATSFESFMIARIVNGFFSTVGQAGGLMFIKDIFHIQEYPRRINFWSGFIVLSPYLGPFSASFIIWRTTWRWTFYLASIYAAICWLLVIIFADETFYDRQILPDQQPKRRSRILRLIGIEQWKSRYQGTSLRLAVIRPFVANVKIPVFLSFLYCLFTFVSVVGLNTQISVFLSSPEYYGFTDKDIVLFYIAPIVATILADMTGHWVHNRVGSISQRRSGHHEPESRQLLIYFAAIIMIISITLLGCGLQRKWHYMTIAVSMGLFVFGIMIVTTAINAYLLDLYPEASGEVFAWINAGRSVGGFVFTYFEIKWAAKEGVAKSLGIQASVVAIVVLLFMIPLQFWGKAIRT